MNAKLIRGSQLRELGRHEEAEAFFREAISNDAEDPVPYAELALCLLEIDGRKRDSLDAINRAIALDPQHDFFHAVRSIACSQLDRPKDALEAADAAIAIDPEDAFNHAVKAKAYLVKQEWAKAEDSARRALSLDGDHSMAENILAMALRLQGKLEEGSVSVEKLLADNPEDEMAHFNAGWAALQSHDHKGAEKHFREALRIDPDFDAARDGLIESFRARSPLYRLYLRYVFWIQQFSGTAQWVIIIAVYLGFRFGRELLGAVHPALGGLLTVFYLLLVLGMWLAGSIGNLLIVADPSARSALKPREKLQGLVAGGGFFLGLLLIAIAFFLPVGSTFTLFLGAALVAGAIPAALTFGNPSKSGLLLFGSVLAWVYLSGLATAIESILNPSPEESAVFPFFVFGCLAALLCTFLGNIRALRTERPT